MRRECFCGCGRSIPIHRIRLRAHDTRGLRILEHLQSVRALVSDESYDPHIARWCAKGDMLVTKIAEVVHGERDPWSIDDAEMRIWLADGSVLEHHPVARTAWGDHPPGAIGP